MQAPSDDYFALHIEERWGVKESATTSVSKTDIERLLKLVRQRIITLANGSQEEYALRKIFSDFDLNGSKNMCHSELEGVLSKLGVDYEEKQMMALFDRIDVNGNGFIEFEEFNNFILHHAYK